MQQPPRYAAFCCIWWGLLLLFYDRRDKESVVVAVELQHGGKGFTGRETLPSWRIFFLPSFCFSSSFFLREMSPP